MVREYKRYDEYKDSGIEWLGEIPKDWDITKLKYITTVNMGQSVNSATVNIIKKGVPFLQGNAEFGDLNPKEKHYTTEPKKIANKNEILISVRAPVGDLNIADKKYCIGRGLCAIKPKNNLLFLYELLKISKIYFDKISTGSTYDSISTKDLKNIKLPKPSKKEQQKIASFLDQKTAEIDEIINKKEKLINYLEKFKKSVITEAVTKGKLGDKYINKDGELVDEIEMKDSGIEWIDDVPNNWEVNYIKYYCSKITDGSHHSPAQQSEGRPYITVRNIEENNINFNSCSYLSEDNYNELVLSGCKPKSGDVLLSKDGTVGKVVIVNDNDFVVLSSIAILRPKSNNLLSNFLFYILKSNYLENQMNSFMAGAAIKRITITDINKFIIIVPQLNIQNEIINYLNKKTNQINNLIQRTKESIEKYKEYKKSLIFEAVTGKIDLRDYELEGGEELAEHNNSSETERESISAVD